MHAHRHRLGQVRRPTMTATASSPMASWNTTKRVCTPCCSGTCASPAMVSDCTTAARKSATAAASTAIERRSRRANAPGGAGATSTAGQPARELDQLERGAVAAPAAVHADVGIGLVAGGDRQDFFDRRAVPAGRQRDRLSPVDAEHARARRGEREARTDRGAKARNAASRSASRPSTGRTAAGPSAAPDQNRDGRRGFRRCRAARRYVWDRQRRRNSSAHDLHLRNFDPLPYAKDNKRGYLFRVPLRRRSPTATIVVPTL